jgi:hypothetical protein
MIRSLNPFKILSENDHQVSNKHTDFSLDLFCIASKSDIRTLSMVGGCPISISNSNFLLGWLIATTSPVQEHVGDVEARREDTIFYILFL